MRTSCPFRTMCLDGSTRVNQHQLTLIATVRGQKPTWNGKLCRSARLFIRLRGGVGQGYQCGMREALLEDYCAQWPSCPSKCNKNELHEVAIHCNNNINNLHVLATTSTSILKLWAESLCLLRYCRIWNTTWISVRIRELSELQIINFALQTII